MFPQCSQNLDLRVGKVASCTIKLKLDVRHEQNDEFCPVSLYFFLNGARWYYPLGDRMTREEFYLVSHATGKGRISMNAQGERPYDIKLRLEEVFEIYLAKLQQLHKRGRLTIASIKTYPLARQMEFNSKLLKLAGQTDIMEELQNLSAEELKAVIAMVKNRQNLG